MAMYHILESYWEATEQNTCRQFRKWCATTLMRKCQLPFAPKFLQSFYSKQAMEAGKTESQASLEKEVL